MTSKNHTRFKTIGIVCLILCGIFIWYYFSSPSELVKPEKEVVEPKENDIPVNNSSHNLLASKSTPHRTILIIVVVAFVAYLIYRHKRNRTAIYSLTKDSNSKNQKTGDQSIDKSDNGLYDDEDMYKNSITATKNKGAGSPPLFTTNKSSNNIERSTQHQSNQFGQKKRSISAIYPINESSATDSENGNQALQTQDQKISTSSDDQSNQEDMHKNSIIATKNKDRKASSPTLSTPNKSSSNIEDSTKNPPNRSNQKDIPTSSIGNTINRAGAADSENNNQKPPKQDKKISTSSDDQSGQQNMHENSIIVTKNKDGGAGSPPLSTPNKSSSNIERSTQHQSNQSRQKKRSTSAIDPINESSAADSENNNQKPPKQDKKISTSSDDQSGQQNMHENSIIAPKNKGRKAGSPTLSATNSSTSNIESGPQPRSNQSRQKDMSTSPIDNPINEASATDSENSSQEPPPQHNQLIGLSNKTRKTFHKLKHTYNSSINISAVYTELEDIISPNKGDYSLQKITINIQEMYETDEDLTRILFPTNTNLLPFDKIADMFPKATEIICEHTDCVRYKSNDDKEYSPLIITRSFISELADMVSIIEQNKSSKLQKIIITTWENEITPDIQEAGNEFKGLGWKIQKEKNLNDPQKPLYGRYNRITLTKHQAVPI